MSEIKEGEIKSIEKEVALPEDAVWAALIRVYVRLCVSDNAREHSNARFLARTALVNEFGGGLVAKFIDLVVGECPSIVNGHDGANAPTDPWLALELIAGPTMQAVAVLESGEIPKDVGEMAADLRYGAEYAAGVLAMRKKEATEG